MGDAAKTTERRPSVTSRGPGKVSLLALAALVGVAIVVIIGLVVAVARLLPVTHRLYTDADTIREPAATAQTRDILWQPARMLDEIINTSADDYEPRLSADGLTLFFVRGKAGENADIYVSTRTPKGWDKPGPLADVNSEYDDLGPEPSGDGQSLYFYSDRPGGSGGYDLWVAHRGRTGWRTPINLGPLVNSEFNDYGPALTPDGATLYYSSNRPEPQPPASRLGQDLAMPRWPATLREDFYRRDYDLYLAPITEQGLGCAKALVSLNTPYNEGAPAVSSFGDFLYFASDRPGGQGGFDLYRSRRLHGEHKPAKNLGLAVNTAANELDPGLALGGYALYFSSDRTLDDTDQSSGLQPGRSREAGRDRPPAYNLYYTTSREVFPEIERTRRPAIDWAALWSRLGPNLLWALLALLLLLALLALLRDARGRRLSLLAKCLLASLMAHLLLMLLFNVWEVTASLAGEFRRRGPIRIALSSPARSNDLASQILGRLTSIDTPAPPIVTSERQIAPVDIEPPAAMARLTVDRRRIDIVEEPVANLTYRDTDVQHHLELPNLAEVLSESFAPPTFEMPVPESQSPIDNSEPNVLIQTEPVKTEPLSRPPVPVATAHPVDASAELVPLPPDSDAHESVPRGRSMAQISPASEAPSVPLRPSRAGTIALAPDRATMPELSLATVSLKRHSAVGESRPEIAARIHEVSKRELTDAVLSQPATGSQHRFDPAPNGLERSDSTLAAKPIARAADVPTAPKSSDSRSARRPDFANLPSTEFPLASPDTISARATSESAPRRTDGTVASVRPNVPVDVARGTMRETFVPIEPAPMDVNLNGQPLSAPLDRNAIDSAPSNVDHASRLVSAVRPTLPPATALALPLMEQSSAASRGESSLRVIPAMPESPRAALSVSAGTEAYTSSPASFDMPPSPYGDTDASAEPLVTVIARELDDRRTDHDLVPSFSLTGNALTTEAPALDLRLPTEQRPPENPYLQRVAEDRMSVVERMGGSEETERAVADALRWLAEHQSADGRWDGDGFDERCGGCGGQTDIAVDRALTGLALLSFLGAGHTHVSDGPYKDNVGQGLRWLLDIQEPDGDLRGDETMYTQGIATIALSEAYGMTGDAELVEPVRLAVGFIDRARNRSRGGWRYDPGQVGDTSVLGWQVMALKSASMNGIAVPAGAFMAAREWLDLVSRPSNPGLYAYQPRRRHTPSMTAEGMFTRQLLGRRHADPRMRASAEFIAEHPPDWESGPNTYYWYYATLALFQHRGELWRDWNKTLTEQLLGHQRRDAPAKGSWDPVGEWASIGGRVYQTALCTLMLEVYYRYLPLYSLENDEGTIGTIRGYVTDASTGKVLPGAAVRLDLPDRSPVSVTTGADGGFVLPAPEVPDFFALSASMEGFVPETANVESARLKGTTLALDFQLRPDSREMVAIESVPEVHHLGDDNFEGVINSQFQRSSEGSEFSAAFELTQGQLPPHFNTAEVWLLAKGVQRRHRIRINGEVLDTRLDDAPEDGGFGEFTAPFDASLLREGTNTFEIIAAPSSSDIDDFEFVNVRIRLSP